MNQSKMRFPYYFLLVLIIISCNCIGQNVETNQHIKSRHDKWIADLNYFENEYLTKSKTFSKDSIVACKKHLDKLRLRIDSLNDNQIILNLSRCVAMANNAHTTIHLNWMNKIPLRFFWFSDGMYIIKSDSANSRYLGYRVLKINSISTEEVIGRLKPYLSGIDRWKKYIATNYLCSPQILNGIGLTKKDSMTLLLSNGIDTLTADFGIKKMEQDSYEYETWSHLYPNNNQNDWIHILKSDDTLPSYLNKMRQGVFYEFIPKEKLAYFSINALWYKCPDFKGMINEFIDSLKMTNGEYNLVIDLRFFTGGNYLIPLKLATKPPKILNNDKKIFLITSSATFSAGLNTAARVKHFAKDKIVIVGEHVGDNLKFWAEGIYYKLPNSKLKIQDSKYHHDWENDKFTPLKTYYFNLYFGVPAKTLDVDKEIRLSFEEYLNYKDPIMDWILEQQ